MCSLLGPAKVPGIAMLACSRALKNVRTHRCSFLHSTHPARWSCCFFVLCVQFAVVGGGLMGAGIATALLVNGAATVYLKEVNQKFLDDGVSRIKSTSSCLSAHHAVCVLTGCSLWQPTLTGCRRARRSRPS